MPNTNSPRAKTSSMIWQAPVPLLITGLLIVEAVLFYVQAATHVAPFYPPNFDQSVYLYDAYHIVEALRVHGLSKQLWEAVRPHLPNTALFPIQGAVAIILTGLIRTGALTVNLAYFLALQFVVFWFVTWKRQNILVGWIAVSLLLLLETTFATGGILDFRIDFTAMCLFGIWVCVVLRSDLFRRLGWSLLSAAIATWLIANRYISAAYLGPVMAAMLVINLIPLIRSSSRVRRAFALVRSRNIVVSGLIVLIGISPLFLMNWHIIRAYYYSNLFAPERAELWSKVFVGSDSLRAHLEYYPAALASWHLGQVFLVAVTIMLGGLLGIVIMVSTRPLTTIARIMMRCRFEYVFLSVVILLPLATLNLSVTKSPVIGGVLCVPIVLFVLYVKWAMIDVVRSTGYLYITSQATRHSLNRALVGAFLACSAIIFAYRMAQPWPIDERDLAAINNFSDKIINYALDHRRLQRPTVSVDRVEDFMNAIVLSLGSYERYGTLIDFRGLSFDQIDSCGPCNHGALLGWTEDQALKMLKGSDIVILTSQFKRSNVYPYDQDIQEYWPKLMAWAQQNLLPLTAMTLRGTPHQAFVVPAPVLIGVTADGWIESSGLVLETEASLLARWPFIVLTGTYLQQVLAAPWHPHVLLLASDGMPSEDVPTELTTTDNHYEIVIDARSVPLPTNGSIRMAVTFDRYFVPRSHGINDDTRELVVRAPDRPVLRSSRP